MDGDCVEPSTGGEPSGGGNLPYGHTHPPPKSQLEVRAQSSDGKSGSGARSGADGSLVSCAICGCGLHARCARMHPREDFSARLMSPRRAAYCIECRHVSHPHPHPRPRPHPHPAYCIVCRHVSDAISRAVARHFGWAPPETSIEALRTSAVQVAAEAEAAIVQHAMGAARRVRQRTLAGIGPACAQTVPAAVDRSSLLTQA